MSYPGGYADYVAQRGRREEKPAQAAAPVQPKVATPQPQSKKLSYKEQRELDALPERIDSLEKELDSIREALADGTIYRSDPAKAQSLTERLPIAEAELEAAVERWAELEERSQTRTL